eukprot:TRINITY_DN62378_c0_g1_i1.p1 TRINITY_DN62378_c0_g1~~TRINITY_DN62378_c0_g1_i1.p1  ORF type:complete len:221 (+),score=30.00 TRINITY_DN62378_c0_g1_i1:45-665(+)
MASVAAQSSAAAAERNDVESTEANSAKNDLVSDDTGADPSPGLYLFTRIATSVVIIVLDQVTKLLVLSSIRYNERVNVMPMFDLTLRYNRGAAFSAFASGNGWQLWLFLGLAVAVGVAIIVLWIRQSVCRLTSAGMVLVLGGAIGNFIDRLCYGYVVDFLLFYWRDWYYPAFNVADMAITVGVVVCGISEGLMQPSRPDDDRAKTE